MVRSYTMWADTYLHALNFGTCLRVCLSSVGRGECRDKESVVGLGWCQLSEPT